MLKRILILVVLTLMLLSPVVAGAIFIEVPLLVLEPGPAPDVEERSKIGAQTYPSEGSIHLTTARVNNPSGSTTVEILKGLFDSDQHVVPRDSIYPPGQSDEQTEGTQAAQMTQSESDAATAALYELGMPSVDDGVFINEVLSDGPSDGKLKAGDVITGIDGTPISTIDGMGKLMDALKPGDEVEVQVRREGAEDSFELRTRKAEKDGKAELGITVSQSRRPPIEIRIDAEDIGGPSAGLIFALSIYDRLIPEDLTGGLIIAGTGTIENKPGESGKVGEVGSVDLKVKGAEMIGADVFLVPRKELDDARKAAQPGMKVIGISTLSDAIKELRKLAS